MSLTDQNASDEESAMGPGMDEPTRPHVSGQIFFGDDGLRPGWGLLLFVLLFFGLNIFAQQATSHIFQLATSGAGQAQPTIQTAHARIPSEAAGLLAVLLATYLLSRVEGRPFGAYGLGGLGRLPYLLRGLFWGFLCLTFLVAALWLTGYLHFDGRLLPTPAALGFGAVWAVGFACVAGLEETLLRGYAQGTLARGLTAIAGLVAEAPRARAIGFWAAALVLSFIFGLGHVSNAGESPIGVLAAGLFGLVLCFSLARTGSLWWALGFHAAWDWAQSFLYGVPDSGYLFQGHVLATHPTGPPLLSGGLTGPEGSLLILPTLGLVTAVLLLLTPRRPDSATRSGPVPAPASAAYRR